jgi:hypothetical protein
VIAPPSAGGVTAPTGGGGALPDPRLPSVTIPSGQIRR